MVFYMPNRGVARIFVWGGVGWGGGGGFYKKPLYWRRMTKFNSRDQSNRFESILLAMTRHST